MIATELMCAHAPIAQLATGALPARTPFQNLFEKRRQVLCADAAIHTGDCKDHNGHNDQLMSFDSTFKSPANAAASHSSTPISDTTMNTSTDNSANFSADCAQSHELSASSQSFEPSTGPAFLSDSASCDWSNLSSDPNAGEWILEKIIPVVPIRTRDDRDASNLATDYFDAVMFDMITTPPAVELRKLIDESFGREQKFLRQALNVVRPESVHSWLRKALREGKDMSNDGLLKAFGAPDTMLLERALIMHILAKRWHGIGCPQGNPYR